MSVGNICFALMIMLIAFFLGVMFERILLPRRRNNQLSVAEFAASLRQSGYPGAPPPLGTTVTMGKLDNFIMKYFPFDYHSSYGIIESTEEKAIRLLCYFHQKREGWSRGAVLNGIMSCQLMFARRAIEELQKGELSPDDAAKMLSDTIDSMTKDAMIRYVAEQEGQIVSPGQPYNDKEFDPYHWEKQRTKTNNAPREE